jgi:hypothetical protein
MATLLLSPPLRQLLLRLELISVREQVIFTSTQISALWHSFRSHRAGRGILRLLHSKLVTSVGGGNGSIRLFTAEYRALCLASFRTG